ncbi:MAG: gamma-glutamyltransferase, partial [Gemmatimonadaceae bacterium]
GAVDAPRFHHQWLPDSVTFEARAIPDSTMPNAIADSTLARLQSMGHAVRKRGEQGDAHTIRFDAKTRIAHGANDVRSGDSKVSVP